MALHQPGALDWTQSYGYDTTERLKTNTTSAGRFVYGYLDASSLVWSLNLPNSMVITNNYDASSRLLGTWLNDPLGTNVNSHVYAYDAASQRTDHTRVDGSYVHYGYDDDGQLTSAVGKESGGATNRLHEQFAYAYDAAGNLTNRTQNALSQDFHVTSLNAVTNVGRSGTLTVAGSGNHPLASVTVNGASATLYTDNTFAKAGVTLTSGNNLITAIGNDGTNSATHSVTFSLPSTATFIHDLNGNMTSDGTRAFEYDCDNQLTAVYVTNTWRSEFTYDGKMRRRIRKEYTWVSGAWSLASETRYIYDGMVVLQERDSANAPRVTYTRGRDLSGELQDAGGIGGLLARTAHTPSLTSHAYYHADGNGNVTLMVNTPGRIVARYVYDPYGNLLAKTGSLADANLYRFSSKELHANSGLIYYGYRFYEPNLQRWLTRDYRGESEDSHLYRFVGNDPQDSYDPLGSSKGGKRNIWGEGFGPNSDPEAIKKALEDAILNGQKKRASALRGMLKVVKRGGAVILISSLSLAVYAASVASDEALNNIASGDFSEKGTAEREVEDFFLDTLRGDTAMTDLDAATAAAASTLDQGLNALLFWEGLQERGESLEQQ